MSGSIGAKTFQVAHPNSDRVRVVDLQPMLPAAAVVSSVDSITQTNNGTGATPLTISASAVVSTALQYDPRTGVVLEDGGITVPAGKGVQFRATGGTAGVTYTITVNFTMDTNESDSIELVLKL